MDKEKIIIGLSTQIDTIKAFVNRLKKSGYNVHSLDVDLLRQKTIEFYDMVNKLEQIIDETKEASNNYIPVVETPVVETPVVETPVVETPVVEELKEEVEVEQEKSISETYTEKPIVDLPSQESIIMQPPPIIEKEEIIIEKPVITEVEPEQIIEQAALVEEKTEEKVVEIVENTEKQSESDQLQVKQTTYDLFSGNSDNAVAEKFQATEKQSFADKMQKSSITNIREAIGINEKFLFINELFNGDLSRYNKILDDINELSTKKGVDTYLLELKIQFQWADDNAAFMKLNELLDRKYS